MYGNELLKEIFTLSLNNWRTSLVILGSFTTLMTTFVISCAKPDNIIGSLSIDYKIGALSNELTKLTNNQKQLAFDFELQKAVVEDAKRMVEDQEERISKIEDYLDSEE